MIKETVEYALNLKKEYSSNLKKLINDYDISIIEDDSIEEISAYTLSMRDKSLVVVYSNLEGLEKDFVICHEVYHILNHDLVNRCFSKVIGTDRYELEANIFALIFLNIGNISDSNTKISKIINSTYSVINVSVL